jgi:hypothetical protein
LAWLGSQFDEMVVSLILNCGGGNGGVNCSGDGIGFTVRLVMETGEL